MKKIIFFILLLIIISSNTPMDDDSEDEFELDDSAIHVVKDEKFARTLARLINHRTITQQDNSKPSSLQSIQLGEICFQIQPKKIDSLVKLATIQCLFGIFKGVYSVVPPLHNEKELTSSTVGVDIYSKIKLYATDFLTECISYSYYAVESLRNIENLLALEIDINSGNGKLLHAAVIEERKDIVLYLLDKGADAHLIHNNTQQSVLHLACIRGNEDLITIFLNHGCDPSVPDVYQKRAVDYLPEPLKEKYNDILALRPLKKAQKTVNQNI